MWRVERGYGFEAYDGQGTTVIKDGLAQLAEPATEAPCAAIARRSDSLRPDSGVSLKRPWGPARVTCALVSATLDK